MANSKQIMALLKAHINGDEDHFFSVAMQLAASEAKHGHGNVAIELRKLIDDAKIRRKSDFSKIRTTPISKPRGELAELLEVSYPKNILKEMILADEIGSRIVRIIKEQRNYGKIQSHGLTPRRKLLLVGPPGTGKTLTASVLAGELGIPLFLVRLEINYEVYG